MHCVTISRIALTLVLLAAPSVMTWYKDEVKEVKGTRDVCQEIRVQDISFWAILKLKCFQ